MSQLPLCQESLLQFGSSNEWSCQFLQGETLTAGQSSQGLSGSADAGTSL